MEDSNYSSNPNSAIKKKKKPPLLLSQDFLCHCNMVLRYSVTELIQIPVMNLFPCYSTTWMVFSTRGPLFCYNTVDVQLEKRIKDRRYLPQFDAMPGMPACPWLLVTFTSGNNAPGSMISNSDESYQPCSHRQGSSLHNHKKETKTEKNEESTVLRALSIQWRTTSLLVTRIIRTMILTME